MKTVFRISAPLIGACFACAVSAQENNHDEHHDIDEIVVSALPIERTVEQLAQPASVIEGDALARKQASSIGETLANEPGVSAAYFGPVASRPVIRGQYGERVRVLSNGLDAMDASALSEDHAVSIDSILAKRVEIIRGPATLLYGSGAAAGLVNIVDSRIHEEPLGTGLSGAVALGGDTAIDKRSSALSLNFGGDSVVGHIDYFRRETGDVDIPGFAESARLRALEEAEEEEHEEGHEEEEEAFGTIENTSSETEGAAAGISMFGEAGFIGLSVSRYDTEYGLPGHHHHHEEEEHEGGEEEEHEEEESVRVDMKQNRYDLRGSLHLPGVFENMKFRVANNDYEHVELEGDGVGTIFKSDATDVRIDLIQNTTSLLSGAIGLQYKVIDFSAIGEEAFVPESETTQLSLFAFEEWTLGNGLTLQASARIEQQDVDTPMAVNYDDTAFGASLGTIWHWNDTMSLAASLSISERHPNSTELYADGPHLAVERFERGSVTLGNGLLEKELSTNLDVTVRGDLDRFEWAVTAFMNNVDDYILLSPTAGEEDGLQVFNYMQTDVELYGFEAEALIDLYEDGGHHLHTRLFTDYVHGEESNTGAYLPRLTPLRYGLGVHYTYDLFEVRVDAAFHDDQNKTAIAELPTDSYTMLDFEASFRVDEANLLLFLRGTNLGDEDARRHSSPIKDIAPLPGRSFHFGVRWDF